MSRGGAVTYIYALCEPDGGEVRYVGKADRPEKRLTSHCMPSARARRSHRSHWIRSLTDRSLRPSLVILERVAAADWQEAERDWIAEFRRVGARLTNNTDGGEGCDGYHHSEGARSKMRARVRQPHTPEHCAKIAAAGRGRRPTPETIAKRTATLHIVMATPEYREKLRAALTGKPKSEAHRAKLRKPKSAEHRAKLSAAAIERWARAAS